MSKKLEVAPRYFGELWAFLTNRRKHVEDLLATATEEPYPPWTAFATGLAIFLSLLALDAARTVRFFERVVFFSEIVFSAGLFTIALHLGSKVAGGKATLRQTIGGAEYVLGFLLPLLGLLNYTLVTILNLFPGMSWRMGYFKLDTTVPTAFNHMLVTVALITMVAGVVYGIYRMFVFFKELEQLNPWRTTCLMVLAVVPHLLLHRWIEFYAVLFAGVLQKIAAVLGGGE